MTATGGARLRRPAVLAVCGAVLALALGAGAAGAIDAATPAPPAAPAATGAVSEKRQELLERYAPVMVIRKQPKECDGDERYRPMSVDYVLGRDDVVLRDADGNVVKRAPTASDLAGRGPDFWLDFPGDALRPKCEYEKWFRSFDATPSIYGRLTEDGGQLVAQYWFYWAYNQWNDLHESDWEMIQVHFDTDDVDKAIEQGPSLYAYAQHEGAELADAGEDKVEIVDGTHPVVYSSGGSHASYFSSTRWFGKSGATGFGCDDTSGPTRRLTPEVIVLPEEAPATGKFAWLSYQGHWGQQERFFNDGPTGPAAKDRWDDPVEWVDDNGREASVALPFARSGATKTFCTLSAQGSQLFNRLLDDPVKVATMIVLALVAIVVTMRFGSRGLLGRAARSWWRHRRVLLPIAAVTFAGAALALVAQLVVVEATVVGRFVDVPDGTSPWVLPLVTLAGVIVIVPFMGWVVGAAIAVEGGEARARRALRRSLRGDSSAMGASMVLVAVTGLALFVFLPFAAVASMWLLAPAVSERDGLRARAALTHSRRLLHGHRWRSVALALTLCIVLMISGLLGALVLLVSSLGFAAAALAAAAVNAFVTPYVALVLAHFHDDVVASTGDVEPGAAPEPVPV